MNLSESDKQKLRDAFSVRASVSGNLMNFIGLDEVRACFPEMWERNCDRIRTTTLAILKQYTDARTDVVLPVGDINFVVLFTRLDSHEALLRASVIKAEILRRFMGDDALATLDIQVKAMEMDSGAILSGGLAELLTAPLPAASHPAVAASDVPLRPPERRPGAEPNVVQPQLVANVHRSSLEEMLGRAALPVDEVAARLDFSFDELEFGFQPFLYAERGVFTIFGCRATRYSATGDILSGYDVLPREAGPGQVSTLDKMVLMRARHGLVDMALRKRVALVGVPVSFETMSRRATATEYLNLLQKVPSDLRNYVLPVLCRCPPGVPEGRLAEITNPLRRLGRAVSIRLKSIQQSIAAAKAVGAYSVGVRVTDATRSDFTQTGIIERFAARARRSGIHSYVDGITSPEIEKCCRSAGVTFLGGRALAELSDYVGPASQRHSA